MRMLLPFVCVRLLGLLWAVAGVAESFTPTCTSSLQCQGARSMSISMSMSMEGSSKREELLSFLSDIHRNNPDRLPCGLEAADKEREKIAELVSDLQGEPNLVLSKNGKIEASDLVGEWDLLYTSSRAMVINKSLSGLGRSSSSMASFASLRQKLTGSKFLGFVEYVERIEAGEGSFDVTIKGEWMLQSSSDLFTRQPLTALRSDLEILEYGPTTNKAVNWTSLGPIKLLDILYLADGLQIARGSVNADSIFVFQKID